jgi:hypothetical protein
VTRPVLVLVVLLVLGGCAGTTEPVTYCPGDPPVYVSGEPCPETP